MNPNSLVDPKTILVNAVFTMCSEDPSVVGLIIDAATKGVKQFASNQKQTSSDMAACLADVLSHPKIEPIVNFQHFSKKDVLDKLQPYYGGTLWNNEQISKIKD